MLTEAEQSYLYYVSNFDEKFSTINSEIQSSNYTTSILSLSTYEYIDDFTIPMELGAYQLTFTPNDKPFLKIKSYNFWILDNEPLSSDDFNY